MDFDEEAVRAGGDAGDRDRRYEPGDPHRVRRIDDNREMRHFLEQGDDGPLATLGPEPDDPEFERLFLEEQSGRHVHTLLRDQHFVSGVGRGYADDALNRARLSPFAPLKSLSVEERQRLVDSVRSVMAEALERERTRTGALSEPRLGERFLVHNRVGEPCLSCGDPLRMVSFESHEVVYCPTCQTKGKVLADRRLSRLLR